MNQCDVCGTTTDVGETVKIITGGLVSKSTGAGTFSGTTAVNKTYGNIQTQDRFVCNDCRRRQNRGLILSFILALIGAIWFVYTRSSDPISDAASICGAVIGVGVITFVLWIVVYLVYLVLAFGALKPIESILTDTPTHAYRSRNHLAEDVDVMAMTEQEYKQKYGG